MTGLLEVRRAVRAVTLTLALGLCVVAWGDDSPGVFLTANDGPVYAFISVSDTFELPEIDEINEDIRAIAPLLGSRMICLKVGSFLAGTSIRTTRYISDGPILFDPLAVPPEPGTESDPANFEGNHVTIVGCFKTRLPDNKVHLMTPYTQPIAANVQQAYFNAAPLFATLGLPPFPSMVEVALFIYDHQGTAGATFSEILEGIFHVDFEAPVVVETPTPNTGTAEGDLFPHTPGDGQFSFDLDVDLEEGVVDTDVCMDVEIDVKPDSKKNTVNVGSDNGVLPIAVITTDDFDATFELDPDTVVAVLISEDGEEVNVVAAERFDFEDVDGDGDDDVTFKFSVPALVDGPNAPLSTTNMTLTFRGDTFEGMCIQGSDTVRIVPKK